MTQFLHKLSLKYLTILLNAYNFEIFLKPFTTERTYVYIDEFIKLHILKQLTTEINSDSKDNSIKLQITNL